MEEEKEKYPERNIRVLVVEHCDFFREIMSNAIENADGLEIAGTAEKPLRQKN